MAEPPPPSPPNRPDATKPPTSNAKRFVLPVVLLAIVGAFAISTFFGSGTTRREVGYSQFIHDVGAGQVASIQVNTDSGTIHARYKGQTQEVTTQGPKDGDLPNETVDLLERQGVSFEYTTSDSNVLLNIVLTVLPFALIIGLIVWMNRRAQRQVGAVTSIGRSKAKLYSTERPRTVFADVAGYAAVKEEVTEVVDFLTKPERFREIGAKIPKGILLVGPPGTGKTLIARAVAGEAGVPFLSVTGSDFVEMFVGVGAARVRDLFESARKQAPAIIFIDEIDSIGRRRGTGLGGGHDEREQTLNQILAEMDGFEAAEGVVIVAATNRPDTLDPALLRPGRFDRQVLVPLPSLEERHEILQVHVRGKRLADDVDLGVVARGTPGMSGAELANLVNEAALRAARRRAEEIRAGDFEAARDRVLMGLERRSLALSGHEQELVAFHEAGHAVMAYLLPHADPVHKVTILPTGMALGVTQQLPESERHLYQQPYLEDSLAVRLGGRAAEDLFFGTVSTGAQNDLVGATELARKMVREWGMSDRLGPIAFGSQGQVFLGEDLMHTRDYSDDTARVIDEEVERILRAQEARTGELLSQHRPGVEAVALALLQHESIDGAEVRRLVDDAAAGAGSGTAAPAGATPGDGNPATPNLV
jgi:cell division protease FtsH